MPLAVKFPEADPHTWQKREYACGMRVMLVCLDAAGGDADQGLELLRMLHERDFSKPLPKSDPPGPLS